MSRSNLAGRAGRWSAAHWKTAFFGWIAFTVVAMAAGGLVGHVQMRDSQMASGEVARAIRMLERANVKQPAVEDVLIQSRSETTASPGFLAAAAGLVQTLSREPNVTDI